MNDSSQNALIGVALSGGGVKGLAHIGLLKKLDALQIKPDFIAGTSMGAIIGALYATGMSGQDIEDRVREHIVVKGTKPKQIYRNRKNLIKWAKIFSFSKQRGGFFAADGLFEHLFSELVDIQFSDLNTRFCAVATNFHTGKEVVLNSGDLITAVKASMAVPGIFEPQNIDGLTLVDGGLVNNLPVNHVQHCDTIIASNVISLSKNEKPKASNVLSGSLSIMIRHNQSMQLETSNRYFLHDIDTSGVDTFDFIKIRKCLEIGDEAAERSGSEIVGLLG